MTANKLVVCDVCDTLYRSNTTFDFIRFVSKKESRLKYFQFSVLTDKRSPVFYLMVLAGKILRDDVIRRAVLKLLKGKSSEEIMTDARMFYNEYLLTRVNETVFQLLSRNQTDTVVLVSSSIDPVVQVIAQACKVSYVSSRLEWKGGKTTGNLETDLTGEKQEVAKKIMKEGSLDKLQVITDNHSDWNLVSLADERFVIIRSPGEKEFWAKLNPEFIIVS